MMKINEIDKVKLFFESRKAYDVLWKNNPDLEQDLPKGLTFNDIRLEHYSLSYLIEHKFLQTPCIEIKFELIAPETENTLGYYTVVFTDQNEFLDEFLTIS